MARFDSEIYHRRSIRLRAYDYSRPGAYFITICTRNRECLFGEIINNEMHLNVMGTVVQDCWNDLSNQHANVKLDAFVVMPNHVHGIIVFVGAGLALPKLHSKTSSNKGAARAPLHCWAISCGNLNQFLRSESIVFLHKLDNPSGNAITTNMSFGMKENCNAYRSTSRTTRYNGHWMKKILIGSHRRGHLLLPQNFPCII